MTDPTIQVQKPASERRRSNVVWMSLLSLFVVGGLVGLVVGFLGSSCPKKTSPLRGATSTCPATVPLLNAHGMAPQADWNTAAFSSDTPPSCATNAQDPTTPAGRYFAWQAPSPGHVTLAAGTVLVDASTCECVSTTTFAVTAHQTIRVWTTTEETTRTPMILDFTPDVSMECPETASVLAADGSLAAPSPLAQVYYAPPSCAADLDPQSGQYYQWTAPSDGVATLAAWSVLIKEDSSSCACMTTVSTFGVTAGQVVRLWSSAASSSNEDQQPLQFRPACPAQVAWLDVTGKVNKADLASSSTTHDTHALVPSCANQDDPMNGVYYDWEAPADGQALLAAWTVLVHAETCDCLGTALSTLHVQAGEIYRVWTAVDQAQPIQFLG